MDLVILLLLLPSVNLLFVEGFFEFVDPIDLILDLCRGDDDPGSESVNFDDLWDIGESFDGNDFLVEMELELEWEWELELGWEWELGWERIWAAGFILSSHLRIQLPRFLPTSMSLCCTSR